MTAASRTSWLLSLAGVLTVLAGELVPGLLDPRASWLLVVSVLLAGAARFLESRRGGGRD